VSDNLELFVLGIPATLIDGLTSLTTLYALSHTLTPAPQCKALIINSSRCLRCGVGRDQRSGQHRSHWPAPQLRAGRIADPVHAPTSFYSFYLIYLRFLLFFFLIIDQF
jgi:hypothetical protein